MSASTIYVTDGLKWIVDQSPEQLSKRILNVLIEQGRWGFLAIQANALGGPRQVLIPIAKILSIEETPS